MTQPDENPDLPAAAVDDLVALLPAPLAPGLSAAELDAVEHRYGFRFSADHRALLARALPVGDRFPDWRDGDPGALRDWLGRPAQGVLFDVRENGFWHPGWGERPADRAAAVRVATDELSRVPPLVPVYGHRYLPGIGGRAGHPVLSTHQTDIIVYGADLGRYLRQEFGGGYRTELVEGAECTVPFWSTLVS
ncbi:MAG: hypothetical protein WCA46_02915 [Actinocatenispora sp.]